MAVDVNRPGRELGVWRISCDATDCSASLDAAIGAGDQATKAKALDRARMLHWSFAGDSAYCPKHKEPEP